MAQIGVTLEQTNALDDTKFIIDERGTPITIYTNKETEVSRDIYNTIKNRTKAGIAINAFPVKYSPTQYQLEKAGLNEKVDVLITIANKDLINNSIGFDDVDKIRWEIDIAGSKYLIKDLSRANQFADTFLSLHLGLNKKE